MIKDINEITIKHMIEFKRAELSLNTWNREKLFEADLVNFGD